MEKDYFGLLYTTPIDPRVWLDLEKPVAKFFKTDPWVLQFAVKFYPPEPAQLQEDITRYHLCLQVKILFAYNNQIYTHLYGITIVICSPTFRSETTYWKAVYHVLL